MSIIPHRIPDFIPKFFPNLHWRMPTNEKIIYLTFDDGPIPGPTEFVLDVLQSHKAKATFFCIGHNVKKYPELFKKIVAGGHVIGNHTFNHLNGWSTPVDKYLEDIEQCDRELSKHSGQISNLFRPPFGRISNKQIKSLNEYRIVMWSVLSQDYDQQGGNENYLKGTIKATRPGSIVVFHDSVKADPKLRYILPRYMQYFIDLGFTFQSL